MQVPKRESGLHNLVFVLVAAVQMQFSSEQHFCCLENWCTSRKKSHMTKQTMRNQMRGIRCDSTKDVDDKLQKDMAINPWFASTDLAAVQGNDRVLRGASGNHHGHLCGVLIGPDFKTTLQRMVMGNGV